MKTVKSISYRTINVTRGKAWVDTGEIHIDKRLRGQELLYIIIHEILHCQNPKWSEAKIIGHAEELSRLLWQQNFRKVELK